MSRNSPGRIRYPATRATPATAVTPIGPASSVVNDTSFGQSAIVGTDSRYARQGHSHGTPTLTDSLASAGTYQWISRATQIAAQDNPSANPWSYAIKIWLPYAQPLHGFGCALLGTGTKQDGALLCSVWGNAEVLGVDWPTTEYTAARTVHFFHGKPAGPVWWPLQSHGVDLLTMDAGYNHIVVTVDTNATFGITRPNVEWLDGGAMGKGFSHAVSVPGLAGFVSGVWDTAADTPQRRVPNVWCW